MKLVIQIPAYNEEDTLGLSLSELPKSIPGIESIEVVILDDGSTDNTVSVARANGATHVLSSISNQGLAKTFSSGIDYALAIGADIIVNTDADNQYQAQDIQKLVQPILDKKADIVVGTRPIKNIEHFSWLKKKLQFLGSWVVRKLSNTQVADATSGFRALSRQAALQINIFSEYTYTTEMLIQAGQKGFTVANVPIRVNKDERPSKLVKNIFSYIRRNAISMTRIFITYRPFLVFLSLGILLFILGIVLGLRWVIFFMGQPASHIPSLILASVFLISGLQLCVFALVADLISVNRKLLEKCQKKIRDLHHSQANFREKIKENS